MKKFTINDSSWNQIKGRLRQQYAQLTDDDLAFAEGKSEELIGRLEEKLGMNSQAVNEMLLELQESFVETAGAVHHTLQQAKEKAAKVAGGIKDRATILADDLKATAAIKAGHLKHQAEEVYHHAKDKAHTLHEATNEYVRQKPRKAMFTALAAGFVCGLMIRH